MATLSRPIVHTSREARDQLGDTLAHFRNEGAAAQPFIFGSQRKPEAVVLPIEVFEAIAPILEDLEIAALARKRISEDSSGPLSETAALLGLDPADFL